MAEIKNDPQKLRDFCDQLGGCTNFWQDSTKALNSYMARLGKSWRDDQFDEFVKEVGTLRSSLDKFAEDTSAVISELRKDAEKLEQFRSIQPKG